jgi:hypothetical protein
MVTHCLHDDASIAPKAGFQSTKRPSYSDNNFLLPSKKEAGLIAYAIEEVRLNVSATLLLMHTSLCQAFQVELSPEVIMAAANVQDVSLIDVLDY